MYKVALKAAYYELTTARDNYRLSTVAAGIGMHHDSVKKYVEYQALLLKVIAPHWSDYIWQEVLKQVRQFYSLAIKNVNLQC
jgi:leucyl-tRNA synthetase